MTKRYLPLLAWLAIAGLPVTALAQPVGPEFQVNTYRTGDQEHPSIASDASGNFVVVWQSSYGQDGDGFGIFGQRYEGDGNPLGGEFQVNTYTTGWQGGFFGPSVASDASGNFVVVWSGSGQDDESGGVFGQRYDNDGNPLGSEFQVNTYTTHNQWGPSVASDAAGNFVVAWQSYGQDGSHYGIFGQRYDNDGNPLGGEFQVNTYTTGAQENPSVASSAGGNFVVVWQSDGIFGQRYDDDGNRLGGEFQVDTIPSGREEQTPAVATDASGNFVVVWRNDKYGVVGQRYDRDGNPRGGEFKVTLHGPDQMHPAVSSDASGNFVVTWEVFYIGSDYWRSHLVRHAPGSQPVQPQEPWGLQAVSSGKAHETVPFGIYGQRYGSHGKPVGPQFQVNTYTTGVKSRSSVASDANGNFVVVWGSNQDRTDEDIFGQRFSAACEASLQVAGDVHPPSSTLTIQVHIAHHRPKTVTVPWELRLIDASGQVIARHTTAPHTFEPGDVVDRAVEFRLPDNLAAGTYTLELGISGMAGTKGATTTLRVVRAE